MSKFKNICKNITIQKFDFFKFILIISIYVLIINNIQV